MIRRQFQLVARAGALLERGTPRKEIASILKVPPFVARKLDEQGSKLDDEDLERALALIQALESGLKGGSNLSDELQVEMAVLKLSEASAMTPHSTDNVTLVEMDEESFRKYREHSGPRLCGGQGPRRRLVEGRGRGKIGERGGRAAARRTSHARSLPRTRSGTRRCPPRSECSGSPPVTPASASHSGSTTSSSTNNSVAEDTPAVS